MKGVDNQMKKLSFRPSDSDIENTVKTYSNMLFKLCFVMLRSNADAEDAVSEVMIKYLTGAQNFTDDEHKKAWLIRVAVNKCKDMLRFYRARNHINIDEIANYIKNDDEINITSQLMNLPEKYRIVIHLYYIEGYKTAEIAKMLSLSPSAVRKRLQYGRDMLKLEYGKDELL